MAKNYHQPGGVVSVTAPAGGVESGGFVVVGTMFGVATGNADAGDPLELALGGVWRFSGLTGSAGDAVYHDGSDLTMDDGTGSNTNAGVLIENGLVRLNDSFQ